jgi:hypothetical protein
VLLAGTLPGIIAGSVIRVYLLPGPVVFDFVVAAVLIPLGGFLALTPAAPAATTRRARLPRAAVGVTPFNSIWASLAYRRLRSVSSLSRALAPQSAGSRGG